MCGIAGIYYIDRDCPGDIRQRLGAMSEVMAHRGPDGEGTLVDGPVGLAHRRLAIVDVEGGVQPMANSDGQTHVVFNGEIYNHRALRRELAGYPFQTNSDTEVLIAAYERWGDSFPARLNGIFAFAIWDARRQRLLLARDALGVKPLHVHQTAERLAFASEIKSLLALPDVDRSINDQALHDFMNVRYVPGTETLFAGIERLRPGFTVVVDRKGVRSERYFAWDREIDRETSVESWKDRVVDATRTAVERQLMSDVPLGVYLSGGLDSTAIVAMMHELGVGEIRTFSLGFNEPTDELDDAAVAAGHFETSHAPMSIDPEPLALMPRVLWHVEEPQVNMLQGYYIAEHAARHVKVALSGLGGDELFAGYINNTFLRTAEPIHRWTPAAIQRFLLDPWARAAFHAARPFGVGADHFRRSVQLMLSVGDATKFYGILRNVWDLNDATWRDIYGPRMLDQQLQTTMRHFEPYFRGRGSDLVGDSLWLELHTKMIDDFLLSEDRVSMAHGLEVRVPFLDPDLVRLAFSIPTRLKMPGLTPKALFRDALASRVPERIARKKKWGFSFNPYHQYQKDLARVAREVLTRESVERLGIFNYRFIEQILNHRPVPRMRWHYFLLWVIVGVHQWHELFFSSEIVPQRRVSVAA